MEAPVHQVFAVQNNRYQILHCRNYNTFVQNNRYQILHCRIITPLYKIRNIKFYIVEITTPSYKIRNIKFYIVEVTTPSFKITNIKSYIVEPTTPLDNQLQCILNHLNKKLFLSRPHKPEGLKEILKHPKVTTTRCSGWKINRLRQQE